MYAPTIKAGTLNQNAVLSYALWLQCIFACAGSLSGKYGDLLDMISFVVVCLYMLAISGIFISAKRSLIWSVRKKHSVNLYCQLSTSLWGLRLPAAHHLQTNIYLAGSAGYVAGVPVYYWIKAQKKAVLYN